MLKYYDLIGGKVAEGQSSGSILVSISPSEAEQKKLISEHGIDEHSLVSALDPDEPARIEQEPDHITFIFKRPKNYSANDRFLFKVSSIGFFVYREKLIIVLSEDIPLFNGRAFFGMERPEDVFLRILSQSIRHYLEHLKVINQIADEIEGLISVSMENKHLLNLFSLEKSLVYYLSAVNSNGYSLEKLKALAPKIGYSTNSQELIDDLLIENTQCYRQAEIHSNILASLMDARASIVSNNLNILMKTLNLSTIFIMVPTFVVSAFSMNIDIPFEHHPKAFWIVLTLSLVSLFVVMVWWNLISTRLTRNGSSK